MWGGEGGSYQAVRRARLRPCGRRECDPREELKESSRVRNCSGAMQPRGAREVQGLAEPSKTRLPHLALVVYSVIFHGALGFAELSTVYSRGHKEVKKQAQCR